MAQPPPIPKSSLTDQSSSSFAHHAARASWIAPLAAIGINIFGWGVLSTQPQEYRVWGGAIFGGAACLLIIVGLVLGVVALCGMAKHGTKGILGQALTGTILCGLLTVAGVAAIPAFQRAKARAEASRKSLAEVKEATQKMQEAAKQDLHRGSGISNTEESVQELQDKLQQAAKNMSGNDALLMQASSAYFEKMNGLKKEYDAAVANVKAAKVLVASSIKQKDDLKTRREATQAFLDANHKLETFVAHGEQNFRAEFERLQVSDHLIESAVAGYRKKGSLVNPLVVSIRQQDDQIGTNMLAIIDLEETNWGHWSISGTNGKLRFEDTTLAHEYNDCLRLIREAAAEQARLQKKLLTVTSTADLSPGNQGN